MKHITLTYKETCQLSQKDIEATAQTLKPYIQELKDASKVSQYDGKETSLHLPEDTHIAEVTCELAKAMVKSHLKYVFICGIGGSNLGPLALYEAMTGRYDLGTHIVPKIICLDTVSSLLHLNIQEIIEEHIEAIDEFVICLVSKSGSTTETVANFDALHGFLHEKFGAINHRVVVVTAQNSPLWIEADKNGYKIIDHPNVGGRYSMFSTVGQVPLRLAGFDVDSMVEGANVMRDMCLTDSVEKNPSLASAVITYLHYKKGLPIHNSFFFNPELESLGKWYRQLMGESLGKEQNLDGETVNAGIMPIVSIGSNDLHSTVQLYFAGPNNTFTHFVYAREDDDIVVENTSKLSGLVPNIEGKKFGDIMDAIYSGVTTTYSAKKLPYIEVQLPEISENTIGQYMQMKMIEMMLLAKLMNVNPFDQPNVEDYKIVTRRILAES